MIYKQKMSLQNANNCIEFWNKSIIKALNIAQLPFDDLHTIKIIARDGFDKRARPKDRTASKNLPCNFNWLKNYFCL